MRTQLRPDRQTNMQICTLHFDDDAHSTRTQSVLFLGAYGQARAEHLRRVRAASRLNGGA